MKPSERAKKIGFKSLKQLSMILEVTEQTVINKSKNKEEFDILLIGAKHKLTIAEIEFYQECAERENLSFNEWFKRRNEI